MLKRMVPWKLLLRFAARWFGFMDPVAFVSHIERFGQPSPVSVPIELLRAGVVFHARGLLNTKAIQYNLDWVWPYWVQRQFNPRDEAFVPRAFSFTHINLTQRNWTALGLPECNAYPIVDPRGLITPFFDGWSIDAWVVPDEGPQILPSKCGQAQQILSLTDGPCVSTRIENEAAFLESSARVVWTGDAPLLRAEFRADSEGAGWLVIALRPFNPEGVSFVHDVTLVEEGRHWQINNKGAVSFSRVPERHSCSDYAMGDVHLELLDRPQRTKQHCDVGLATAAALFRIPAHGEESISLEVDLGQDDRSAPVLPRKRPLSWKEALEGTCGAELPDPLFQSIFDASRHSLVLLAPDDVYPGPYTYKRFWFRDAAFILNAMTAMGLFRPAERVLDNFKLRQRMDGFFLSQDGEWDANGAALWAYEQYLRRSGLPPKEVWRNPVLRGAEWILRNRCPADSDAPHAGLLPAGFSAEHLGNNDYYYWDDFFAVAGLRAAAKMGATWGEETRSDRFGQEASNMMQAIERSLNVSPVPQKIQGIPASPYRRMDAGAIGSIVAAYPLDLLPEDDSRMRATVHFILENCLVDGAFFQDMIHSGLNAYLTLMLAQVLLREGDPSFMQLVETVAGLASPTGQWPEAIHPRTRGGCMGDGQHLWAAAEWLMIVRNMFVREDKDGLILASGLPASWQSGSSRLGPTPTPYGPVTVSVGPASGGMKITWHAHWRRQPARMRIALPGYPSYDVPPVSHGESRPEKEEERR